eukprot:14553834-Heterocapsa_arctica.AAC.1
MEAAPWRDGAEERKQKGGYPPEQQEGSEWDMKTQLRNCETCGLNFMTTPQGWNVYIHKHCCSRCTATGGWKHTK